MRSQMAPSVSVVSSAIAGSSATSCSWSENCDPSASLCCDSRTATRSSSFTKASTYSSNPFSRCAASRSSSVDSTGTADDVPQISVDGNTVQGGMVADFLHFFNWYYCNSEGRLLLRVGRGGLRQSLESSRDTPR